MSESGLSSKRQRISVRREKLILAMLQQPTLEAAAAMVGISRATAWRISKTLEFREELQEARRSAICQSLGRLQQGSAAAASTLLKIMVDPQHPAGSRVRAADRVLEHATKVLALEDLNLRLRRLEDQIRAGEGDERVV